MKKIFLILGVVFLLSSSLYLFFYFKNKPLDVDFNSPKTGEIEKDSFNLSYSYEGNSVWKYKVSGFLPNPCYDASVEEYVMESYPEQVNIVVSIIEPDKDVVCAQVIAQFEYEDEFSASEYAKISLSVR